MHKFLNQIVVVASLIFISHQALAVPVLQLDIGGGYYEGGSEESIMTTANTFSVYGYATANGNTSDSDLLSDTYYLSVALAPKVTSPGNFGSFTINGTTVNATADMVFGKPPTEAAQHLGAHDIYSTYYYELAFSLVSTQTSSIYNTQDNAGTGPITPGSGMFYVAFDIDRSNLSAGTELHFDLYNTKVKNNGNVSVDDFAPFSHDAATAASVPEPAGYILATLGLAGLLAGRKRRQWQLKI